MSRSTQQFKGLVSFISFAFLFFGFSFQANATHNRAGEITYEQIDELTIRATITTYTKTSSFAADRDSVEIFWGDGTNEFVVRANNQGQAIENDVKINYYIAEHTYPTRGTYTMGMFDPNRVAGVLNIDFPNSVNITFYVQTTFSLLNTQFQGRNSSVVLLQPPIDLACVGELFVHNPNAYDPDGDSISYEFAVPFQDVGEEVPNYLFPDEIAPGPENVLTLDPETGEIRWNSPQTQGEVNLTIKINEYREGVLINSLIRDMQITVKACMSDPTPPEIEVPSEICVVAGEKIDLTIISSDVDTGDQIILSATGGPFLLDNSPGVFRSPGVYLPAPITGFLEWQTTCNHARKEPYQIVFKAVDDTEDGRGDIQGLATLKTMTIKVVAPPPLLPEAEVRDQGVTISWESPYRCEETEGQYFRGFGVWRKNNSTVVPLDSCQEGIEGFGYEKILFVDDNDVNGRYTARDITLEGGQIYCYRVLAEFANLSPAGNPFNIVESLRSEEVCVEFLQDRPLFTKVSVSATGQTDGIVQIEWVPPLAEDLDTIANPGPYRYSLIHSDGVAMTEILSFPFTDILAPGLSSFTHENLNTDDNQHQYRLDFYAAGREEFFSKAQEATSVFLNLVASDERITLSWREEVPWSNFEYDILRQNSSGEFDTIALSTGNSFIDFEVENGVEYCYQVISKGRYRVQRVPGTLVNHSQIECAFPLDTVAPCLVQLKVRNLCDDPSVLSQLDQFENVLSWTPSMCSDASDISGINVYYAEREDSDFNLIGQVGGGENTFIHSPQSGISGCYAVTTLDIVGNESVLSNSVCLDNCPLYELPNTFTPNGDGANDQFVPRINRFIATVDFEVYNKWGQIVFKTTDPALSWDGTNMNGKELAEGSYYFTARIVESRLDGNFEQEKIRTGHINLIR